MCVAAVVVVVADNGVCGLMVFGDGASFPPAVSRLPGDNGHYGGQR